MNIKKFLITELEKKNILKQYGILSEVAPTTPTSPNRLVIDKRVVFPAGYYNESYILKSELPAEIKKIIEYLKVNKGKIFVVDITVESGESKIPNTDNELNKRVDVGYLSKMRGNTINEYVNKTLAPFIGVGKIIPEVPRIIQTPFKPGKTEWKGQPFCPSKSLPANDTQGYVCLDKTFNPGTGVINNWYNGKDKLYGDIKGKYIQEQYIRVVIRVNETNKTQECLENMVIEVNYTDLNKKHTCNQSIYEIYVRGDLSTTTPGLLLYRNDGKRFASLNNNNRGARQDAGSDAGMQKLLNYDNDPINAAGVGKERFNKFVITPEIAASLITDGSENFIISAKCLNPLGIRSSSWGNGCHRGVGNIVVTNGNGERTEYISETPTGLSEIKELVTMNACGKGRAS